MTTLYRLGSKLYNPDAFAKLDLHFESKEFRREPSKPGVELTLLDGSARRYEFDDQAERLRDFLEGRFSLFDMVKLPGGLTVVNITPAPPPPPEPPGPDAETLAAVLAAVECRAALDRYFGYQEYDRDDEGKELDRMTATLQAHGWPGGSRNDARDWTSRLVAKADLLARTHAAEAAGR